MANRGRFDLSVPTPKTLSIDYTFSVEQVGYGADKDGNQRVILIRLKLHAKAKGTPTSMEFEMHHAIAFHYGADLGEALEEDGTSIVRQAIRALPDLVGTQQLSQIADFQRMLDIPSGRGMLRLYQESMEKVASSITVQD